MKNLLLAGGLIAIVGSIALARPAVTKPTAGKAVPAFSMTSTSGAKMTDKSLRGKVVLLDFWATWCGPCKAASPTMQALHTKYNSKGLVVVGANVSENNKQAARDYFKNNKYTYTLTQDNDALAQSWGVQGIPYFVLIGRDGKVAKVWEGFGGDIGKQMDAEVAKLIARK